MGRSCTLVPGEVETRAHGAVLCSFCQETNPGCQLGQVLIHPTITTQGTHKGRHAQQGVSWGLPCRLPPTSPSKTLHTVCPRAAPEHSMASSPHGNIHLEHPALLFLPSPRKAMAWGSHTCPKYPHQPGLLPA